MRRLYSNISEPSRYRYACLQLVSSTRTALFAPCCEITKHKRFQILFIDNRFQFKASRINSNKETDWRMNHRHSAKDQSEKSLESKGADSGDTKSTQAQSVMNQVTSGGIQHQSRESGKLAHPSKHSELLNSPPSPPPSQDQAQPSPQLAPSHNKNMDTNINYKISHQGESIEFPGRKQTTLTESYQTAPTPSSHPAHILNPSPELESTLTPSTAKQSAQRRKKIISFTQHKIALQRHQTLFDDDASPAVSPSDARLSMKSANASTTSKVSGASSLFVAAHANHSSTMSPSSKNAQTAAQHQQQPQQPALLTIPRRLQQHVDYEHLIYHWYWQTDIVQESLDRLKQSNHLKNLKIPMK